MYQTKIDEILSFRSEILTLLKQAPKTKAELFSAFPQKKPLRVTRNLEALIKEGQIHQKGDTYHLQIRGRMN